MEPELSDKLADKLADTLAALDQRLARIESSLAVVDRLAGRIERVEALIDALGTFAERLPTLTDAAGSGVAFALRTAGEHGVDPIEAGLRASGLALELLREENLSVVDRLLAKRPLLEKLLAATDAIDEQALVDLVTRGAALLGSPELSGILDATSDPQVLATAAQASTALVETRNAPSEPVGLFGALSKMGDPDVKRAVGFTLAVAKRFGQRLAR